MRGRCRDRSILCSLRGAAQTRLSIVRSRVGLSPAPIRSWTLSDADGSSATSSTPPDPLSSAAHPDSQRDQEQVENDALLIGAAVGITMARYDMTHSDATTFVRHLAAYHQRPLLDVARTMTVSRWPLSTPFDRNQDGSPVPRHGAQLGSSTTQSAAGRLLDLLVETTDLTELLTAVAELAVETIPGCDSASITVIHDGNPTTVAYSDERALAVDETQYSDGHGPCLQAARTDEVVEVADLLTSAVHEPWRRVALDAGITATLSLPIASEANIVAALNLHTSQPHGWPGDTFSHADDLVTYTGDALTLAYRHHNPSA